MTSSIVNRLDQIGMQNLGLLLKDAPVRARTDLHRTIVSPASTLLDRVLVRIDKVKALSKLDQEFNSLEKQFKAIVRLEEELLARLSVYDTEGRRILRQLSSPLRPQQVRTPLHSQSETNHIFPQPPTRRVAATPIPARVDEDFEEFFLDGELSPLNFLSLAGMQATPAPHN